MNTSNSFEKISNFSREQRDIIQEKIQSRMKELSSEKRANQELIAQKVNSLIALISNVIDEVSVNEIDLLQNLLDYTEKDPIWKKTKQQQSTQQSDNQLQDISFRSCILNNISEIYDNSQEEIPITDLRSRILQPSKKVEYEKLTSQERGKLEQLLLKKLEKQNSPINSVKKRIFNFVIDFFSTQELIQLDWKQTLDHLQSLPYITQESEPADDIIYFEYIERNDLRKKSYLICDLNQIDKLREWLNLKNLKQIIIPQQFTRLQECKVIQIEGRSSRQIVNQLILALPTSLEQVPGRATKFYGHYVMPKASKDQLLEFQQTIFIRNFDQVIEIYNQYFNQLSRIIGNPYTMVIANSINPYSKKFIISLIGEVVLEPGKGRYIDTLTQTEQRFYIEQFNQEGYDIILYPLKSGISAMLKNNLSLDQSCQFIRFSTKIWIENKTLYQIKTQRLEIEINL